jgi:hypothetical protein
MARFHDPNPVGRPDVAALHDDQAAGDARAQDEFGRLSHASRSLPGPDNNDPLTAGQIVRATSDPKAVAGQLHRPSDRFKGIGCLERRRQQRS